MTMNKCWQYLLLTMVVGGLSLMVSDKQQFTAEGLILNVVYS